MITIIKCDLFKLDTSYALCHCISSDFKLGAGIAKVFADKGVKQCLTNKYPKVWCGSGFCLQTKATEFVCEYNLVTKEHYWDKPTLQTLESALLLMRYNAIQNGIKKIAMPKIGCGLDKLSWGDVSALLHRIFDDTDIAITVCML